MSLGPTLRGATRAILWARCARRRARAILVACPGLAPCNPLPLPIPKPAATDATSTWIPWVARPAWISRAAASSDAMIVDL
eukprot:3858794-Pyramimonas_sp.AAC.1